MLKRYDRRADNHLAPDEYKALHPMGIAPVITDGEVVLGESAAICEYINVRYGGGQLAPSQDDPDFADHLFWFHWSNATFMTTKMMALALSFVGRSPSDVPFVEERARRSGELMEKRLGDQPYFGGRKLTLADIMMVYSLTTSRAFSREPLAEMPNTFCLPAAHRPARRLPACHGQSRARDNAHARLSQSVPLPVPSTAEL